MRCLVTGGLGFIGSHLVKRLLELGHDVTVVDNGLNPSGSPCKTWRVDCEVADFVRDDHSVETFDWIFHLAAVSRTAWAIADPLRCHLMNASTSVLLLDAVRDECPKARVVLASSNIIYGSANPYRASKLAMEEYMSAYNALYGLNCIALRYSNVYGPGMRWDDPICLASMRRSMVEKGYIELTGDGTQSRDFTHVSDIVEGTIAAAESSHKGIIDLTSGHHRSMKQMAELLGLAFNGNHVEVKFTAARPGDTQEIRQMPYIGPELAWRPSQCYLPESGIRDVIAEIPSEVRA